MENPEYIIILDYESGITHIRRYKEFVKENDIKDIISYMEENYPNRNVSWMNSNNLLMSI